MLEHTDVDRRDLHGRGYFVCIKVLAIAEVENCLVFFRKCFEGYFNLVRLEGVSGGNLLVLHFRRVVERHRPALLAVVVNQAETGDLEQPGGEFRVALYLIPRQSPNHFKEGCLEQVFGNLPVRRPHETIAIDPDVEAVEKRTNRFAIPDLGLAYQRG